MLVTLGGNNIQTNNFMHFLLCCALFISGSTMGELQAYVDFLKVKKITFK